MTRSAGLPQPPTGDPQTVRLPAEWLLVAALVCAGFVLRVLWWSHPAVEHFDEGVYASNLFFQTEEGAGYPQWWLYAPPLLSTAIEFLMLLTGPTTLACLLPALATGTATLLVVWGLARWWGGPIVGLAALALAATSEVHILFSRTALTDVPVTFFVTAAVAAQAAALAARDWRPAVLRAVGAGILTALAWWTKYSGWLPLSIAAAGTLPWLWQSRADRAGWLRGLSLWGVMAATAVLVWLPVPLLMVGEGGYAAVAANHARYVTGWSMWLPNAAQQLAAMQHVDSRAGLLMLCGSLVLSALFVFGVRSARGLLAGVTAMAALWAIAAAAGVAGSLPVLLVLAVIGLAGVLRETAPRDGAEVFSSGRRLTGWLLAAWIAGLLVSVPMYRPYLRLMVPLLPAVWIAAAAGAVLVMQAVGRWSVSGVQSLRRAIVCTAGLSVVAVLLMAFNWPGNRGAAWQDRTGLRRVAAAIAEDARRANPDAASGVDAVVYVLAEPALFWHLSADPGRGIPARPAQGLGFVGRHEPPFPVPILVAVGPHAERLPAFAQRWEEVSGRFEPVGEYEYTPSDLVQLDEVPAGALRRERAEARVRVYRLREE